MNRKSLVAAANRGVRGLKTAGDVAAEAFRMFDQGGELKDIVSALRITPAEVRRLYKEWQSQLDDPPPAPESSGPGLLDEDPRAEEAFLRAMAQATSLAFPPTRQLARTPAVWACGDPGSGCPHLRPLIVRTYRGAGAQQQRQ